MRYSSQETLPKAMRERPELTNCKLAESHALLNAIQHCCTLASSASSLSQATRHLRYSAAKEHRSDQGHREKEETHVAPGLYNDLIATTSATEERSAWGGSTSESGVCAPQTEEPASRVWCLPRRPVEYCPSLTRLRRNTSEDKKGRHRKAARCGARSR
jgi:hypothetical protein